MSSITVKDVQCIVRSSRRLDQRVLSDLTYTIDVSYTIAVNNQLQKDQLIVLTGSSAQTPILQESFLANLASEIVKKREVLPMVYTEIIVEKKMNMVKVESVLIEPAISYSLEVGAWSKCACGKSRERVVTCTSSTGEEVDPIQHCECTDGCSTSEECDACAVDLTTPSNAHAVYAYGLIILSMMMV